MSSGSGSSSRSAPSDGRPAWLRYGVAVATVVVAVLVRLALDPVWAVKFPLLTFYPAVMVAAWFGGLGPGLITTLASTLAAAHFWLSVTGGGDAIALGLFVGIGVLITGLNEALHRARRRLRASAGEREELLARETAAHAAAEAANATLQESESRLKVTLASIGDAIIATDGQGRVTLMNGVAEALTGWTRAEAIGRPLEDVFVIVSEVSRQPAENPARRVLREGKITGLANRTALISKTGREIPIDDSAAPIREEDGRLVGVVMVFRDITERRRAEERFRLVVESAPNAIVVAGPEGVIILVNAQTEKLFGYRRDELIGQPVETLVPLRFRANHPQYRRSFFADPKSRLMGAGRDLHGLRKDGTEFPVEIGLSPVETEQGTLVLSAIVDITERKRAEGHFRLAIESAPSGMVMANARGRIVLVNAHTERLFGYSREELVGQSVEILVPERFRVTHPGFRGGFMADPRARPMGAGRELYGRRKDGGEFPVEIGLSPIETEEGMFVLSAIVDITERQRLERERAALLEREQAARTEAERVAGILRRVQVVTDRALGEVSLDGLMHEFLAYLRTAMAGDTATILLLAEDGAYLVPASSDGLREELTGDVRIPLGRGVAGRIAVSEAGLIFPDLADVVLSPFLGDRVKSLVGAPLRVGTRLIGVLHVGVSVPRRFTEEDLTLLRLVADRVALIIARARLHEAERAARRDAEAASRAKDEFLATLSHELRQPINAIVGWLQVVRTGKRDEVTLARALEAIERNAKLQEQLVSDLLDVSRTITGRLHLDIQPVDLVAVIGAAIDVVRPAAEAKGIRLETALDPSGSLVSGDPGRLQQILWNLLSNAIRFTRRGGRVEVRLRRVDSHAELAVSDTGEGISAAFLPHVFERFRQADRAPAAAQEGLGLGLAIVRQLVELHGGTVHADSPGEGRGATFTVKLPLLAVQASLSGVDGVPFGPGRDLPPESRPGLGGVRVLIVDDDPSARELLRTVLEKAGAVVSTAGSVTEAIEVFERERPEVLVSDIAMPGEDGYALIRKVRALPRERGGRIPAVAVTAHARAEDRTRALLAGFHLHVPKPVEAAELVAVVASLIGRTADQGTPGAGAAG